MCREELSVEIIQEPLFYYFFHTCAILLTAPVIVKQKFLTNQQYFLLPFFLWQIFISVITGQVCSRSRACGHNRAGAEAPPSVTLPDRVLPKTENTLHGLCHKKRRNPHSAGQAFVFAPRWVFRHAPKAFRVKRAGSRCIFLLSKLDSGIEKGVSGDSVKASVSAVFPAGYAVGKSRDVP